MNTPTTTRRLQFTIPMWLHSAMINVAQSGNIPLCALYENAIVFCLNELEDIPGDLPNWIKEYQHEEGKMPNPRATIQTIFNADLVWAVDTVRFPLKETKRLVYTAMFDHATFTDAFRKQIALLKNRRIA